MTLLLEIAHHLLQQTTSTTTDAHKGALTDQEHDLVWAAVVTGAFAVVAAGVGVIGIRFNQNTRKMMNPEGLNATTTSTEERVGDLATNFERFMIEHNSDHREINRTMKMVMSTLLHHVRWEQRVGNRYSPNDPRFKPERVRYYEEVVDVDEDEGTVSGHRSAGHAPDDHSEPDDDGDGVVA